jgi:large subunit ribosomal protein L9
MKVILMSDVDTLGKKGDTVNVKEGYAANYLFPRELAIMASKGNIRNLDKMIKNSQLKDRKEKAKLMEISKALESAEYKTTAKCGPNGKLFGSITSAHIQTLIKKVTGLEIERRKVHLDEPIKLTGEHEITLKLHSDIVTTIKVTVEGIEA